jgi:hypothetical protein
VRHRLQAKATAQYSADDWLLLVDFILQTRIPDTEIEAASEWLAWRGQLAARLDVAQQLQPGIAATDAMMDILTGLSAGAAPQTATQARLWSWAKARVGLHLTAMRDATRHRIANTILSHIQERGLSRPAKLEQSLRDDFGVMNRDWRRVAITETGEAANLTYLSEFPDGTRVKRLEAYEGACPFCRSINGRVFVWSETERPDSDGWTHVWPGKTNVGRSASPRKRTEQGLVERTPAELWWPAAGVQHPHCRGRWLALPDETVPPGVDPDFAAWLKQQTDALEAEQKPAG